MKILHVIPSLSPRHGGPSLALPLMARSLADRGVTVDVATTDDDGPGGRLTVPLGERVAQDGFGGFYFCKQTEFYKVSLPLGRWLKRHVRDYDVVHVHALFSYASLAAARCAWRAGVPYVIRPLGVLNRWGMANRRRWLKALSFRLLEGPIIRRAAALHYTSDAERVEAVAAGASAPARIIPLGIDTAAFQNLPAADILLNRFPQAKGRKLVLFLSRLDPKKGLELLLEAWRQIQKSAVGNPKSEIRNPELEGGGCKAEEENRKPETRNRKWADWLLVIAGSGEAGYERALRAQAERLGVADSILWTGFLAGPDKLSALAAATVFVLPSYSENFGIALIEAMAAGLPCLTTPGVALAADVQARADNVLRVVPAEVQPLAAALGQLLDDAGLRMQLGANAQRMAVEYYSLPAMGVALENLYKSILAEGAGGRIG